VSWQLDLLIIQGALNLNDMSLNREKRYTIRLKGTGLENTTANFDINKSYRWKIIAATGGIASRWPIASC
jgi:hypothetical protein